MTVDEAMKQLEAAGTAQNRKVYARHGIGEPLFGVSFASLRTLAKAVNVDHELARGLWATGNHDARVLATMIADPDRFDGRTLDRWARDLGNYVITDAFAQLVSRSALVREKMEAWTAAEGEWVSRAGWRLLSYLALEHDDVADELLEARLGVIERDIHDRPNRTRDAMNGALIAIGLRNARLEKKAVATAKRIGMVEVDHGETSCETPDAAAYIAKAKARRRPR
jgi:3-methyladenine DNA glycosylase AlkD